MFGFTVYFACAFMLWIFCTYHLTLVYRNTTTAEAHRISKTRGFHVEICKIYDWLKEDREAALSVFTPKELKFYRIDKDKVTDWKYCKAQIELSEDMIAEIDAVKANLRKKPFCKHLVEIFFSLK